MLIWCISFQSDFLLFTSTDNFRNWFNGVHCFDFSDSLFQFKWYFSVLICYMIVTFYNNCYKRDRIKHVDKIRFTYTQSLKLGLLTFACILLPSSTLFCFDPLPVRITSRYKSLRHTRDIVDLFLCNYTRWLSIKCHLST